MVIYDELNIGDTIHYDWVKDSESYSNFYGTVINFEGSDTYYRHYVHVRINSIIETSYPIEISDEKKFTRAAEKVISLVKKKQPLKLF